MSHSVICQFVPEVCSLIWETTSPMHLRMPADEADWKLITENFRLLWDLVIALEEDHLHIPMMNLSPTPLHWEICLMSTLPSRCFLWKNLRRPYHSHGRVFDHAKAVSNFRLTWARQLSENRFGILVERWQIYKRRIELTTYNVTKAVFATCFAQFPAIINTTAHFSIATRHPVYITAAYEKSLSLDCCWGGCRSC